MRTLRKSHHEAASSESFEDSGKPCDEAGYSEFTQNEDLAISIQEQQTQEDDKSIPKTDDQLTSFLLEQATREEVGKNESTEMDEYDGPHKQEESDNHFKETLATG